MNLFKKIKYKAYSKLVEDNLEIKTAYQLYCEKDLDYHRRHRFRSWIYLLSLIFSKQLTPSKTNNGLSQRRLPYLEGSESNISDRRDPLQFAKNLINYDFISFDIFDTLILRPFDRPQALFTLLGERHNIIDFKTIRIQAEKEARESSFIERGNHEVTIQEIYKIINEKTGIDIELGVTTEFEAELELCFANPYMMRVFKILKAQKKRLIACSDMYLPEKYISQLLEKCGFIGFEKIYVSCDYNCSKRTKGLYQIVLNYIGKNTKIAHIGDNEVTDYKYAKDMGMDTFYYKNVHEIGMPYRADGMSDLIGSAYSGIVNTHLHNGLQNFNSHYEYGFIYGGLYVFGFCNWIYKYAKKNGIDKILFLSRDGEIYQRVFNMMHDDLPNDYVYWSRIANTKYTLENNRYDFLTRMVHHKSLNINKITISSLLRSLGLESLESQLNIYHLCKEEFITNDNKKMLEKFFVHNWDSIIDMYKDETEQMQQIIKNTIKDAKKVAIVDVGWLGTGPLGLKYLIEKKWKFDCKVDCLIAGSKYYNRDANINELMNEDIIAYMFSTQYNRNNYDTHSNTNRGLNSIFFELFTQASYPSFAGLGKDNKMLFDIPEVENYKIINEIHKGIFDFSKAYYEKFDKFQYLYSISGYDAYLPFRMIIRDLKFLKKHFAKMSYNRGVGGDADEQMIDTIEQIIENAGF